jgi:hypothetical protein
MKATKKYISIESEFTDYGDLQRALRKIWEQVKTGKEWNRVKVGSALIQFEVKKEEFVDYREEMINGKFCIVLPSKMNDEKN